MFEGFTKTQIETKGATINLVHGGSGPPLLLLHGNPFNYVMWHKIAPDLARDFTVVAADLRGYGDSSKPDGGPDHAAYSFRAMAEDQVEIMASLGFDSFLLAGHDRGARVSHRLAPSRWFEASPATGLPASSGLQYNSDPIARGGPPAGGGPPRAVP